MKSWIQTFTGKRFDVYDPQPDMICIEDIAHALSLNCRFTGHTKYHYSVAQHSLSVASLVPQEDQLWGLLHDASEAYLADLARPIKHHAHMGIYLELEAAVMDVIIYKFGLNPPMPASVKVADNKMLWAEAVELMGDVSHWTDWKIADSEVAGIQILQMAPSVTESRFLQKYKELMNVTPGPVKDSSIREVVGHGGITINIGQSQGR